MKKFLTVLALLGATYIIAWALDTTFAPSIDVYGTKPTASYIYPNFKWQTAIRDYTNTYNAVVDSDGALKVTGNVSPTAGTNLIGTFTLVTNLTITNYVGTDLAIEDSLGPGGWEINPVCRANNGTAYLMSACYFRATNTTADCIDMVITDRPITWPAASTAVNIAPTDGTNVLSTITFGTNGTGVGKEWVPLGTNMICTIDNINTGIKPSTNSIYLYFKTRVATTNNLSDYVKLTIKRD